MPNQRYSRNCETLPFTTFYCKRKRAGRRRSAKDRRFTITSASNDGQKMSLTPTPHTVRGNFDGLCVVGRSIMATALTRYFTTS